MPRENRGVVKINIYLTEQVLEALRRMALARGCAYSELIREACRAYVVEKGPELVSQNKTIAAVAK